MNYSISAIAIIVDANFMQQGDDVSIEHLLTDSRQLLFPASSLFFALQGGESFIENLYEKGVRNFITDYNFSKSRAIKFTGANILSVKNVLKAMQELAAFNRHQYYFPVIGITGSNGKTIVKEWLNQLLLPFYNIVRSPKSYNSQTGVPLSVWRINEFNTLGIFESGISLPGEMEKLQKIIDPEIGIVTFIGTAHDEGFESTKQKIKEKLLLFKNSKILIFCADDEVLYETVLELKNDVNKCLQTFTWSKKNSASLQIQKIISSTAGTLLQCLYKDISFSFSIPFTDDASVNNAITCCCVLLYLQINIAAITMQMATLKPLEMRLELKQGINNCSVINDGYSADLDAIAIALHFLEQQQQHNKRTVILSDVLQSGNDPAALYKKIAAALTQKKIDRFIGIGKQISDNKNAFASLPLTLFFDTTEIFLEHITAIGFSNETILLKGARIFKFEKISQVLEQKVHETLLEINLNALRHNLKMYKQKLQPGVAIMAMVKAFSYGSGSFEIANMLQHSGTAYLAVAYADEGADLRRNAITLPIMVMNTEPSGFESLVKFNLQPELYSFNILKQFAAYIHQHKIKEFAVHIKIDTGMHRLGFEEKDIDQLCALLQNNQFLKVLSVFSHLAGSDAAAHDDFTLQQADVFLAAAKKIETAIGYSFLKHISNSSAIYRHPALQLDMVRLGIGLYGVDATQSVQQKLQHVTTLKTTISQIKHLKKGDSIGYSRKGIAERDITTATTRIGYADGYPRVLSNGKGKMLVNGNFAPVIGNVCMDMTMLDITGIDAHEGDEVVVFGETPSVTDVAGWASTISYEILTNISQRVKRVYFEE